MNIEDMQAEDAEPATGARSRILAAASRLIAEGGIEAATTRAVAVAAGVQAPTIYRFFGDKRGLLIAVAEHEMARHVGRKGRHAAHPDPVEDLRLGWDAQVALCLSNPGLFAILLGEMVERGESEAAARGRQILAQRIRRVAQAGRLATTEERAVAAIHSAATGVILALLQTPGAERDAGFSPFMREMAIAAITSPPDARAPGDARRPQSAAAELRAALDAIPVLSAGERLLMTELLNRIATAEIRP